MESFGVVVFLVVAAVALASKEGREGKVSLVEDTSGGRLSLDGPQE